MSSSPLQALTAVHTRAWDSLTTWEAQVYFKRRLWALAAVSKGWELDAVIAAIRHIHATETASGKHSPPDMSPIWP